MKKLMCAIAAVSAGICLAGVESANIVGYSTITVESGKMVALTAQFEGTDGEALAIPNLVQSSQNKQGSFAAADQIWRWQNSEWRQYYNAKATSFPVKQAGGWCLNKDTTNTTDRVSVGETFFFVNHSDYPATLTLSGAVKPFAAQPAYQVESGKLCFIGYPWPVEMEIASFSKYCSSSKQGSFAAADQIWRWQNSEWRQYYNAKATSFPVKQAGGWCLNKDTTNTTDRVAVGEGFFFMNNSDNTQTITFTNDAE